VETVLVLGSPSPIPPGSGIGNGGNGGSGGQGGNGSGAGNNGGRNGSGDCLTATTIVTITVRSSGNGPSNGGSPGSDIGAQAGPVPVLTSTTFTMSHGTTSRGVSPTIVTVSQASRPQILSRVLMSCLSTLLLRHCILLDV
jgi:hypothetical protein